MSSAVDIVLNAGIGAASGYAAATGLALAGYPVAAPAIGALYGALFVTTIAVIHFKADSMIGKIASIVAKIFVATATAVAVCHLYGAAFTLVNVAIMSTVTLALAMVTGYAIVKLIESGYLTFKGLSVENLAS